MQAKTRKDITAFFNIKKSPVFEAFFIDNFFTCLHGRLPDLYVGAEVLLFCFETLVAGGRFARPPTAYETVEVLLLHPAAIFNFLKYKDDNSF